MTNYLLLFTGGRQPESDEESAAVMAAWTAWYGSLGEAVVDGGNPTTPMAKTLHPDGSSSDGPAGEFVTGYAILKAGSLEAAVKMAEGCPHLQSEGTVTVHETFDVMAQ